MSLTKLSHHLRQFKLGYSVGELVLLLMGLVLFSATAYFYATGLSLRKLILNDSGRDSSGEVMGTVTEARGSVRRKRAGEIGFTELRIGDVVFLSDSVVTGSDGYVKLNILPGSEIEMKPNTLARTAMETSVALGSLGISRRRIVDVLSGDVTARVDQGEVFLRSKNEVIQVKRAEAPRVLRAEPARSLKELRDAPKVAAPAARLEAPTPVASQSLPPAAVAPERSSPTPEVRASQLTPEIYQLTWRAPLGSQPLSLAANTQERELPLKLEFQISPAPKAPMKFRMELGLQKSAVAQTQSLRLEAGATLASWETVARGPGVYQWKIFPELEGDRRIESSSHPDLRGTFEVKADFLGIELLNPLVGGVTVQDNSYRGQGLKDFDVGFRWKPVSDAKSYEVQVLNDSGKLLLKREVEKPEYRFNRNKVYLGELRYQVTAKVKNGFSARSPEGKFLFSFLSPRLTLPKPGAVVELKSIGPKGLLFTWQKTSFTQRYDFQISRESEFQTPLKNLQVRENFLVVQGLKQGTYFWRVIAIGEGGVKSTPGVPARLEIR